MPRRQYHPPPFNERITVKNQTDGSSIRPWAGRRERSPNTDYDEGVSVRIGSVVFVIHKVAGINPESEVTDASGATYQMLGPPVLRGGPVGGRAQEYYELHCERRDTTVSTGPAYAG